MFEQALLQTRSRRTAIPLAYILDAALLGALALYPLLHVQALPKPVEGGIVHVPAPPAAARVAPRAAAAVRPAAPEALTAPVVIPRFIAAPPAAPEAPSEPALASGVPGGLPVGMAGDGLSGLGAPVPPPPQRPAEKPAAARVRLGGEVEAARLIFQVQPQYPALAQAAHIQGVVRLEAIISASGAIESLRALSGPPLLIQPALQAVARWRYQPTLLNGEPVEVSTEIDVNFTLGN